MNPKLNVLLVEDNDDDALMMQRAIDCEEIAVPIHHCHNGVEAMAYLAGEGEFGDRERYPFPSMIISDLKMPGKSGFEVLEWLRDNPSLMVIPVIIWSSSSDDADVKHAYCLGANGYLCKPYTFNELKVVVRDMFRYWDHCLIPKLEGPTCEEVAVRAHKV
jgi:CheY-like chemotaxis protein